MLIAPLYSLDHVTCMCSTDNAITYIHVHTHTSALATHLWLEGGVPSHTGHACSEEPHEGHHEHLPD